MQETLVQADRRLDRYRSNPPLPFYPWLRQIAWDQLVDCHRKHLYADPLTKEGKPDKRSSVLQAGGDVLLEPSRPYE